MKRASGRRLRTQDILRFLEEFRLNYASAAASVDSPSQSRSGN